MAWNTQADALSKGYLEYTGINDVGFEELASGYEGIVQVSVVGASKIFRIKKGMRVYISGVMYPHQDYSHTLQVSTGLDGNKDPVSGWAATSGGSRSTALDAFAEDHLFQIGRCSGGSSNSLAQAVQATIVTTGALIDGRQIKVGNDRLVTTTITIDYNGSPQDGSNPGTSTFNGVTGPAYGITSYDQCRRAFRHSFFTINYGSMWWSVGGNRVTGNGSMRFNQAPPIGSRREVTVDSSGVTNAFGGLTFDTDGYPLGDSSGTVHLIDSTTYTPRNSISGAASDLSQGACVIVDGHLVCDLILGRTTQYSVTITDPGGFQPYNENLFVSEDASLTIQSPLTDGVPPGFIGQIVGPNIQLNNLTLSNTVGGFQPNSGILTDAGVNVARFSGYNVIGGKADINIRGTNTNSDQTDIHLYQPAWNNSSQGRSTRWVQGTIGQNNKGTGSTYLKIDPEFIDTSGTGITGMKVLAYDTGLTYGTLGNTTTVTKTRTTRNSSSNTFLNVETTTNNVHSQNFDGQNIYQATTDSTGKFTKASFTGTGTGLGSNIPDYQNPSGTGIDVLGDFSIGGTPGTDLTGGFFIPQVAANRGNISIFFRLYGYNPQSDPRTATTYDQSGTVSAAAQLYYAEFTGQKIVFDDSVLQTGGTFKTGLDLSSIETLRDATQPSVGSHQLYGLLAELHSRFGTNPYPTVDSNGLIDFGSSTVTFTTSGNTVTYNSSTGAYTFNVSAVTRDTAVVDPITGIKSSGTIVIPSGFNHGMDIDAGICTQIGNATASIIDISSTSSATSGGVLNEVTYTGAYSQSSTGLTISGAVSNNSTITLGSTNSVVSCGSTVDDTRFFTCAIEVTGIATNVTFGESATKVGKITINASGSAIIANTDNTLEFEGGSLTGLSGSVGNLQNTDTSELIDPNVTASDVNVDNQSGGTITCTSVTKIGNTSNSADVLCSGTIALVGNIDDSFISAKKITSVGTVTTNSEIDAGEIDDMGALSSGLVQVNVSPEDNRSTWSSGTGNLTGTLANIAGGTLQVENTITDLANATGVATIITAKKFLNPNVLDGGITINVDEVEWTSDFGTNYILEDINWNGEDGSGRPDFNFNFSGVTDRAVFFRGTDNTSNINVSAANAGSSFQLFNETDTKTVVPTIAAGLTNVSLVETFSQTIMFPSGILNGKITVWLVGSTGTGTQLVSSFSTGTATINQDTAGLDVDDKYSIVFSARGFLPNVETFTAGTAVGTYTPATSANSIPTNLTITDDDFTPQTYTIGDATFEIVCADDMPFSFIYNNQAFQQQVFTDTNFHRFIFDNSTDSFWSASNGSASSLAISNKSRFTGDFKGILQFIEARDSSGTVVDNEVLYNKDGIGIAPTTGGTFDSAGLIGDMKVELDARDLDKDSMDKQNTAADVITDELQPEL